MPDVHGDRATYDQHINWTARKATALRRRTLDCGHPNPGEVFYHAWCDRLSCSEACANGEHDCGAFAGVNSSSEEESEPVEAVAAQLEALGDYLEALPPEPLSARRISDLFDVPLDMIEPRPGGSAPADPVADAMRSEVLRQGLATCEIDGVPQEYRDGNWTIIDETHAFSRLYLNEMVWGRIEPEGPIHHGPGSFSDVSSRSLGQTWARTAGPQAYWPEPVAPPVDAALQPDMSECRNDSDIPTRPWWRRIWSRTPPTLLPPSPTEGSTR